MVLQMSVRVAALAIIAIAHFHAFGAFDNAQFGRPMHHHDIDMIDLVNTEMDPPTISTTRTIVATLSSPTTMSIEEKQNKIRSNYETIEVLRARLDESQRREKVGMTRAGYIKMIFDATKKVDRQNGELTKAVLETRQLQRDIRSLCGRLDRSFKFVDETILRDAGGDIWGQECYRLLRLMRESCDQLIQFVQETSILTRELRELEDQIGHAKIRHSVENM